MKRIIISVVAVTGLVLVAATGHATLTTVNGAPGVEWNLQANGANGKNIMDYLYQNSTGTGWTRVDDAVDIKWLAATPFGNGAFDAVYAADTEKLYTANLSGGNPTATTITGGGYVGANPPSRGSFVPFSLASNPFLFADQVNGGSLVYSDPSLNGNADHMVTFAVTGYEQTAGDKSTWTSFSDGTHYVIAFEDGTDFDYNDLVVEVKGVTPVPEPTTMIAGALLLLPFGASTLRILRKNRTA